MVVIAHVSDIHMDEEERAAEHTARVFRYLAGLKTPVDVVLVTGDIADHGLAEEYERARKLTELPVPVLYAAGNHDKPNPLLNVNTAHEFGGARFLLCDSSIPGRSEGFLPDETLAWIDRALQADAPTFVCFHHPPVPLGLPFVDRIRQNGAERLAAVVERHSNIVALLCGHAHTAAATTFAGKPLLVAPGVKSTSVLPFESDAIVNHDEPPMLALHLLDDDGRLTTHYRVVP